MIQPILRHSDPWSTAVIVATLVLFLLALFLKGLSHDLLLEAGVFLVSLKLILLGHKSSVATEEADLRLQQIELLLQTIEKRLHGDTPERAA